jgi:hypothetical protein
MAVTLYRQVGKGKARRYQKVNLGRGHRPADLAGPYFLRYSVADGTRPWELVGGYLACAARTLPSIRRTVKAELSRTPKQFILHAAGHSRTS